jgi:hypothetical protein
MPLGVSQEVLTLAERIVKGLETQADAARARLKQKFAQLGSAPDPTIIADLAIVGAAYLGRASLTFAQWSGKMIAEFGDQVTPYLEDVFAQSKQKLEQEATKQKKVSTTSAAHGGVDRALRKQLREMNLKLGDAIRQAAAFSRTRPATSAASVTSRSGTTTPSVSIASPPGSRVAVMV